jgi:hypothetical protein
MLPMLGAALAGLERINTTYAGCRFFSCAEACLIEQPGRTGQSILGS